MSGRIELKLCMNFIKNNNIQIPKDVKNKITELINLWNSCKPEFKELVYMRDHIHPYVTDFMISDDKLKILWNNYLKIIQELRNKAKMGAYKKALKDGNTQDFSVIELDNGYSVIKHISDNF